MIPLSGPRKLIGFFALFVLAAFSASFLLSSRDEGATRSYYDRLSSRTSFRGALNKEQLAITEAGNRTLGFHKLYFVNLPKRYDRSDVGGMQAFLSGIQLEPYLAVDAATLSDLGMPPTSNPGFLSKPKLACYRAHANVWAEVLEKRLPPVIIMEADAVWDINIRQIMMALNKNFRELLRHADPSLANLKADPADPWHSEHWDMLSIGQCLNSEKDNDMSIIYHDPWAPDYEYYGKKLANQRVIRRSSGFACATAYAISQSGAAKLQLRMMLNLDREVDIIMSEMAAEGSLKVYSVQAPIVAQWKYTPNLGMNERGGNSDINFGGDKSTKSPEEEAREKNVTDKAWQGAMDAKSAWKHPLSHEFTDYKYSAINSAWQSVFAEERKFGPDGVHPMPGSQQDLSFLDQPFINNVKASRP